MHVLENQNGIKSSLCETCCLKNSIIKPKPDKHLQNFNAQTVLKYIWCKIPCDKSN